MIEAEKDISIYDKENDKIVEKCGGGSLLLLFQKLKKKVANFNIRTDTVEKEMATIAVDVSLLDDEIDEINEKLEEIKTSLDAYGVNVHWPETKSIDEKDTEDESKDKKVLSKSDEIWAEKSNCCWTCLHCLPRYVGACCTSIWCMNKDSYNSGNQVHPLSKCCNFSKSTVRDYPPPPDIIEESYNYGKSFVHASRYARYQELASGKSNSIKISFMGVDINTGEESCWE